MRKFIHKARGWVYERNGDFYDPVTGQDHDGPSVLPEFIELSNDREEILEEDWIDKARKVFLNERTNLGTKFDFRYAIEKHAPRVKKFTKDEIALWKLHNEGGLFLDVMIRFFRDHGLLEE